jgi:cholesterol transport system auxiliary component
MNRLALLALPFAAATLSGCIKFGAEPPDSLLTLTPTSTVAVGATASSASARSITIQVPVVPQELAVARVPVRSSDTTVAYLKDAQWVEAPNRLFARLLSDTVSARTGRVVLSVRQALSDPGARLNGELRHFGLDATTNEAVVTFDATLARDGAARTFEKRRFEARVPLAAIEPTAAGIALNTAANQVAGEVADWVGR